ncbi:MAG: hypothetical protein PVG49_08700, partial [Desulfobacteraceae bacterium]
MTQRFALAIPRRYSATHSDRAGFYETVNRVPRQRSYPRPREMKRGKPEDPPASNPEERSTR